MKTVFTNQKVHNVVEITSQSENVIINEIDVLEYNYSRILDEISKLTKEKEEAKNKIIALFEKNFGHETHSYVSALTGNTVQRILNVNMDINEGKLKNLIPKEIWNKITIAKVDQERFLMAIKMGDINAIRVAEATTTKEFEKLMIRKKK